MKPWNATFIVWPLFVRKLEFFWLRFNLIRFLHSHNFISRSIFFSFRVHLPHIHMRQLMHYTTHTYTMQKFNNMMILQAHLTGCASENGKMFWRQISPQLPLLSANFLVLLESPVYALSKLFYNFFKFY